MRKIFWIFRNKAEQKYWEKEVWEYARRNYFNWKYNHIMSLFYVSNGLVVVFCTEQEFSSGKLIGAIDYKWRRGMGKLLEQNIDLVMSQFSNWEYGGMYGK